MSEEDLQTYWVYRDDNGDVYYTLPDSDERIDARPDEGFFIDGDTGEPYEFKEDTKENQEEEDENFFYVSRDEQGREYYFDSNGENPTYTKPEGVRIVQYNDSDEENEEEEEKDSNQSLQISETIALEVPADVAEFHIPEQRRVEPTQPAPLPDEPHDMYLPQTVQDEIAQFKIQEFANQFFRQKRTTRMFTRKNVSIEALVSFSEEPITEPLLLEIPNQHKKAAVACFKNVLKYTGVIQSTHQKDAADQIVKQLYTVPELRDEVYFQLIKQTSNVPNPEVMKAGMELFLIIATIFPSTRNSEKWIMAHLASIAKGDFDITIVDLARFAYIRFTARCTIGKQKEPEGINWIKKIPAEVDLCYRTFGVSLGELLWSQRYKEPKLPIPFVLYHMVTTLLKKGAESHEGIFRLQGHLRNVETMAEDLNNNHDSISSAPINDIASLLKKFIRDLADPIVPIAKLDELRDVYESDEKDYLGFILTLPKIHYNTLVYLIGFLQQMAKAQEVTRMTENNLAIVFAPNIVQPNGITEQNQVQRYSTMAIQFTETLISTLDTTAFYPMPGEYFSNPPQ